MSAELVTRTIQFIIAPVVMVSACAILLGGLLGHYAAINDRLRALVRERLDLLRAAGVKTTAVDAITIERLEEIDAQVPDLLRRHKLVHDAVLANYSAVLLFVVSMFVIALAVASGSAWLATAVLILFLLGTAVLLLGIALTALEVRNSHHAIQYEVKRVLALNK